MVDWIQRRSVFRIENEKCILSARFLVRVDEQQVFKTHASASSTQLVRNIDRDDDDIFYRSFLNPMKCVVERTRGVFTQNSTVPVRY